MKEKVQSILSWEERVSSCTLSTGLPGRCIVVAIPCGRHAWADHHTRFDSQSHSPTISYKYRFLEKKVKRKSISSTGERHGSRTTIHSDILTGMKPLSGDSCAKNSRNTILAGYNRTMAEWAAHISNYPRGQSKEWRPGGRRDPGYQDIPLSHLCELISAMNDPHSASDISRAGCASFQHIPCWLTGTGGQHTAEIHP